MKTKQFLMIGNGMIVILMLLTACGQSATQGSPEMTITFSGDTCTYSGPKSLPDKFDINIVVEGQGNARYGYVLVTLDEGKTIEDLQAWPSSDPPAWLKDQLRNTGPVFGPGNAKQILDWSSYESVVTPIYFVCFADDRKIGALGPIEVTK
jgi:hypothetical protein